MFVEREKINQVADWILDGGDSDCTVTVTDRASGNSINVSFVEWEMAMKIVGRNGMSNKGLWQDPTNYGDKVIEI